jgi:hypothetical protein
MTSNLSLPELVEGQSQGEITHNEALAILDVMAQGSVLSRTTTAQPGSPANGDSYILTGSPTGANWSGQANKFAYYVNGWRFLTVKEGWRFWVRDTDQHVIFNGTSFVRIGIQIAADADVTDSSGGTASGTIAAIGAAYNQNEVRNAVATLAAEINDLRGKMRTAGVLA